MKKILFLSILMICLGCSNGKVFVLKESNKNKYFLLDSINENVKKNIITKSPIFIIDGLPFEYDDKLDTIQLPLTKTDIYRLTFLNKKTANIIYGETGERGAILISTKPNPK